MGCTWSRPPAPTWWTCSACTSGYEVDKFTRCEWSEGPDGVPLLAGCESRMVCSVLRRIPAGDHTALMVEADDASAGGEDVYTFRMAKQLKVEPGRPP